MNVQQSIKRVLELNDHILETIEERDKSYTRLTRHDADTIIKGMKKEIHEIGDKLRSFEATKH